MIDRSLKCLGAMIVMQKNLPSLKSTVAKKIKKIHKYGNFSILELFVVFLDFLSNGILQRVEVVSVVISATRCCNYAIKYPRTMIFIV